MGTGVCAGDGDCDCEGVGDRVCDLECDRMCVWYGQKNKIVYTII